MEFSFKDLDKLDIYSKRSIASVAVLFPFWYVALYLFDKPIYEASDVLLKVLFSFCFSVAWYFSNIFIVLVEYSVLKRVETLPTVFRSAGFLSVLYIGIIMAVAYPSSIPFRRFLVWAYAGLLIFNAVSLGVDRLFGGRKRVD
jgi:hypothetical protein